MNFKFLILLLSTLCLAALNNPSFAAQKNTKKKTFSLSNIPCIDCHKPLSDNDLTKSSLKCSSCLKKTMIKKRIESCADCHTFCKDKKLCNICYTCFKCDHQASAEGVNLIKHYKNNEIISVLLCNKCKYQCTICNKKELKSYKIADAVMEGDKYMLCCNTCYALANTIQLIKQLL